MTHHGTMASGAVAPAHAWRACRAGERGRVVRVRIPKSTGAPIFFRSPTDTMRVVSVLRMLALFALSFTVAALPKAADHQSPQFFA